MQRILTLALSALMISVTIASCSKQGPAGVTGATGPAGAAGPAGPVGPAGNTNIIYSGWDSGFSGTYAFWQVPALTQGVVDSSAVLVYALVDGYGDPRPLPWDNIAGISGDYINYQLSVGSIILFCGGGITLNQFIFRYVIIPPGVASTGIPRSYEEVTAHLGITL
ncbi:MAG TPA: hypothetical protein VKR41_07195 [Puia sp.]|nr:hypothetical protein [Puia sp.]